MVGQFFFIFVKKYKNLLAIILITATSILISCQNRNNTYLKTNPLHFTKSENILTKISKVQVKKIDSLINLKEMI